MNKSPSTYSGSDVARESLQRRAECIIVDTIDEHDLVVNADQIYVYIVDHLKRSRGWCHFDTKVPYGEHDEGSYAIRIDRKIDGFEGTVKHELAHAEVYEVYGITGHGTEFHDVNETIGGSCGGEAPQEYNYYMTCPHCGWAFGRFNYCKKIHSANDYMCKNCNNRCSSYQTDEDPPTEHGRVAERIT